MEAENVNGAEVVLPQAAQLSSEHEERDTGTTNGDTEHAETIAEAGVTAENEGEVAQPDAAGEAGVIETANGTPASRKRASIGGSSKKKSNAVPEHRSKKLNRKKSRPMTNLDAEPGQYFFSRMKGHPPWPSIICDEAMLPPSLLSTRPISASLPDGSFKKPDYAPGGKRAHERTYPVMFLHTNEFAWIINTELSPLDPQSDEIKTPAEKGKSKLLLQAYTKASEENGLDHFKTMLSEHEKAIQEDLAYQEELAAKKAEKAANKNKKSRKSTGGAENGDEMDVDGDEDEDGAGDKTKLKKRKKTLDDDNDGSEKPSKTPKTATKLKLSTPKEPADTPTSKKKASKSKGESKKASNGDSTPKVEEKPLSPEALKEIKEKKVLYYRHKLQRGFLSKDTPLKAEDMPSMNEFLTELEGYPDLESSIIRNTKIHKVLKQMIKIAEIPRDEEFKFKERSATLLAKWNESLAKDGASEEKAAATPAMDAPSTKKEEEKATPAEASTEKTSAAAPPKEESKEPQPAETATSTEESKIGTGVEGEKESIADMQKSEPKAEAATATTDAPDVDNAPGEEYKPPAETSEATAS